MSVAGRLMAWIQLIDCSTIACQLQVDEYLRKGIVPEDDENWELEDIVWNTENNVIQELAITYWQTNPPDLTDRLAPLTKLLQPGEYLTFEESVRFGVRTSTVRALTVTHQGVYAVDGRCMLDALLEHTDVELEFEDDDEGVVREVDENDTPNEGFESGAPEL